MNTWIHDLRYAVRTLRRGPGFCVITVLILALGIGVNTAVFSVVDAALLAPLPFDRPGDLFVVYAKTSATPRFSVSYPNYQDWQRGNQTFSSMGACRAADLVLSSNGDAENVHGAMISAGLFDTLGIKAVAGRPFESADDHLGAGRVAMLDEDFWRERFGGSRAVLGTAVRLSGLTYTVVGIAPRSVRSLGRLIGPARVYTPLGQWDEPSFRDRKVTTAMYVVGRRKDATSEASARADLERVAANLAAEFPAANRDIGITLEALQETLVFRVRTTLLALLGAVGLVLLIACADVANLALVRAAARARELATRAALGAGRWTLARQLLTESLVLSTLGGIAGAALGIVALKAITTALPSEVPPAQGFDGRVLGFVLGLCLVTALVGAIFPALGVRGGLHTTLKEGGRASTGRSHRVQAIFVIAQMALAVVLLTAAGLMIRSVANLWRANPGFDPHNVLTFQVMPAPAVAADAALFRASLREAPERVAKIAGVESASILLDPLPLSGRGDVVQLKREGQFVALDAHKPSALWYYVGPDYFRVMRTVLLRGRVFDAHDDEHASRVMVIDENLSRAVFGDENPLGKRLDVDFVGLTEVVGVVAHMNHWNPGGDPADLVTRQMYFPAAQLADKWMKLAAADGYCMLARTRSEPMALFNAVRAATRTDAGEAIYGERSMQQIMAQWLETRRFLLLLLSVFAALALALACSGVYGALSYLIANRAQELSIRMALGAQRGDILQLVFSYGGRLVGMAIFAGSAAALILTRLIASLLYGVKAGDPLILSVSSLLVIALAAAACYIPARRASRIDPISALKA